MNKYSMGCIKALGASGKAWVGYNAINLADLFFDELRAANHTIQISSFATGHKSDEMDEFFNILEEQMENPRMRINVIINDSVDGNTVTTYSRMRFKKLQDSFPDRFFLQYFKPELTKTRIKILHAKITVIDGKIALIGSANISKSALESNYEIMLKVYGEVAVSLSKMLTRLSQQLRANKV